LKRVIAFMIICLVLIQSFIVISESNQREYIYDQLRFICTDGYGFNEAKYQQIVQMFEQQKREPQPFVEIELINNQESNIIDQISCNDGLMDSPWPMKCHDNRHTGRSPYTTANNNGAELWKFESDTWIQGGPIIGNDGTIYFGDYSGNFYALNNDGSLKWRIDRGVITHGTIRSTPLIGEDNIIYIGCWDDYLYAFYPDGTLKWKSYTGGTITSSPAISEDGTIYIGNMVGSSSGDIVAVNPDGSIKWKYTTGYYITADPAIGDDGTIYIGSGDKYLYAINPDGTLKWRFKTGHYIKGPASITEDGTIYFGSYDDYLYALYTNGTMKWKIKTGSGTETNPSIGPDGTIYVGDDRLYAINPDGTLKWAFNIGEDQKIFQSSPTVSSEGTIYIGTHIDETDGGELISVNSDGTLRWRRQIANVLVDSSPCIGENGIVYIGSSFDDQGNDYGYLYAFGHGDNVNNPPDKPSITGPNSGKTGETYSYSIAATDPDNDQISIYVDWGDNTNSGWQGPYQSGSSITLSHIWNNDGTYSIKAKAKDDEGSESTYATLQVTMPKNKLFFNNIIRFLQNHKVFSFLIYI
jgi:outer membrane protein assembly factor BamB